jgi:predicted dehydrogenase
MLKVALVGSGWSAERFARICRGRDDLELSVLVIRRGADRVAAARLQIPDITDDLAGTLADRSLGAVIVATPPSSQLALAREALLAGKNLIVEKPVGLRADAILELHAEARRRGLTVMVPYHFRFNPLLRQLADAANHGAFGTIAHLYHRMYILRSRRSRWLDDQAESGGVIYETMVHGLDLATWIGGPPVEVSAFGYRNAHGLIQAATIALRLKSGALATLEGSWLADNHVPFGSLDVLGSEGSASFDRGQFRQRHYALRICGCQDRKVNELRVDDDDIGFRGLVEEFVRSCECGTLPSACGLDQAYAASMLAEAALSSVQSGRMIAVSGRAFQNSDVGSVDSFEPRSPEQGRRWQRPSL